MTDEVLALPSEFPGYVDHHVHFLSSVAAGLSLDVSGASSIPELVTVLAGAQRAGGGEARRDGWIRAWGYDESLLVEARHPTRDDLDRLESTRRRGVGSEVARRRPIVVHHRSGHVAVLNSVALHELGEDDHPDGVLYDRHALLSRVPRLDISELTAAAGALSRRWAAAGVGGFVEATHTNGPEELDLMAGWCRSGVVIQSVQMMVGAAHIDKVPPFATPLGGTSGHVSVGHVKVMPLPGQADAVAAVIAEAHRADFPVAVHVVDVETLQVTLDAFARSAPPAGLVDRIEHNALSLPEQLDAIAASRARVVVNPSFLLQRRAKYERELSDVERGWLIRIRSLLDAGVDVRAGSDSPLSDANPQEIIRGAMAHPFVPGESVDLATAQRLLRW